MKSSAAAEPLAERYSALLDLGRVLTGIVRPDDLIPALTARVGRALDAEAFLVSRYDAEHDLATVTWSSGAPIPPGQSSYGGRQCLAIREARPVAHLPGDPAAAAIAMSFDSRMRSALVVPILREGTVTGTLTAIGRRASVFDAGDLDFLAGAANLIAARASSDPRATHSVDDRLDEIIRATRKIAVPEALDHVTKAAASIAGAAAATTWLVRSGGDLEAASSHGASAPRKGSIVRLSPALFRALAERRDGVLITDAARDDFAAFGPLLQGPATTLTPLTADSRVLGAITLSWQSERDAERADTGPLARLSGLASIAIAHGRLHEQIHALSLIDPLTGLANRRHLAMYLEKEFAAARRGRRLTILLLDIDGFADYNHRAGKSAGDAALIAAAEVIAANTRAMNLAARYGGDEFIVALADADRRAGFIHASRIAKAMTAHSLLHAAGLRMSVGIASFSPRMASFEDLVRGAFVDLEARRKGGGRLTI
ncbi:MAG: diguanylate cyclase [Gemmatimonadetes bacterium]|nr:diguanylate cyclase [Gemmatimonadota bacterium]